MREALAEHMREYQVEHAELITKAFSEFHQVRADSCDASWGPGLGFASHARRLNVLCLLHSCGRITMRCGKTTMR